MKVMLQVCKNCGHEQRVKIYNREDAQRHRIRLVQPRCDKCGSTNIKLYD